MTDAQIQLLTELVELALDFESPRREEILYRAELLWDGLVCRPGMTAGAE